MAVVPSVVVPRRLGLPSIVCKVGSVGAAVATASTVFGVGNASCGGANADADADTDADTPAGVGGLLWGG